MAATECLSNYLLWDLMNVFCPRQLTDAASLQFFIFFKTRHTRTHTQTHTMLFVKWMLAYYKMEMADILEYNNEKKEGVA